VLKEVKSWVNEHKENGSLIGIIGAPVLWLVIGFALSTLFISCEAEADWLFPEGPVLYFYGEVDSKNPFCKGYDAEFSSNLGLRQTLWQAEGIKLKGQYTHHSCAFKIDDSSYDALGFGIEWQIGD